MVSNCSVTCLLVVARSILIAKQRPSVDTNIGSALAVRSSSASDKVNFQMGESVLSCVKC